MRGATIDFTPALAKAHIGGEWVVAPGTGLDLAAPLQFKHSANLPFSDRGTGISFTPFTIYDHYSNDPVQPAGTGIILDKPLTGSYGMDAVVRDVAVTTAGYQGPPEPNQWFGGPELTSKVPFFGRITTLREGSMVLRDAAGLVVDSLNYGGLVDPWAAQGYQAASGLEHGGCFVPVLGSVGDYGLFSAESSNNTSAGRYPDGADTNSNCNDFLLQAATTLAAPSSVGATDIKVAGVAGFSAGQTIMIDSGANLESAVVATVGTAGAAALRAATEVGATVIPVTSAAGFSSGQSLAVGSGADSETAVVASITRFPGPALTVSAPLAFAHTAGAQVSGTGITLTAGLTGAHAIGAPITDNTPTPGAPNRYHGKSH
jgi:hypothetical protein